MSFACQEARHGLPISRSHTGASSEVGPPGLNFVERRVSCEWIGHSSQLAASGSLSKFPFHSAGKEES